MPYLRALVAMTAACALTACSDEDEVPVEPAECPVPNRVVGEKCIEPGVQDDGCPAGTLGLEDGSCRPAGIAAEACAPGFAHNGELCEPVLPSEACASGTMAVPGDAACRPIMDCGTAPWGGIPVEPDTEYVDGDYAGTDSDGSAQKPWTTLGEAYVNAAPNAIVAVAAGSYADLAIAGKPVRLWGVCPQSVTLGLIQVGGNAAGTEIHDLATVSGLAISGSENVIVDRVWIHDIADRGLQVLPTLGSTSVVVSRSLVERASDMGIYVSGSKATIESTVVRETQPRASDQTFGRGINIQLSCSSGGCNPRARSDATVRGSLIEANHDVGMYISGSDVVIDGTVVRRTLPRALDQFGGRGLSIRVTCANGICARSNVLVTSSLFDENHDNGVHATGSDVTFENIAVRNTTPATDMSGSQAINIQACIPGTECDTVVRPNAVVRGSLVAQNYGTGIFVGAGDATIEATVVRATKAAPPDSSYGIIVRECGAPEGCSSIERSNVTLKGSLIEDSDEVGVFILGSDAIVEGTHVRRTVRRNSPYLAHGLHVQLSCIEVDPVPVCDPGARGNATVKASHIEANDDLGLSVVSADAIVEGLLVQATRTEIGDGYGDAVTALANVTPTTLSLTNSLLRDTDRAGVANFAARVSLSRVAIACAALDLDGEPLGPGQPSFEDLGSNVCGCPTPTNTCQLVSTGIAPPVALPPPPE